MTQPAQLLEFVDSAYQAAVDPSLWPSALAQAGGLFGGDQAVIIRSGTGRAVPSAAMNSLGDRLALPTYLREFEAINCLQLAIDRARAAGFSPAVSTDQSFLPRSEFEQSDFYRGYFRRFDMNSVMMVVLPPSRVTLNVIRRPGRPLFDTPDLELAQVVQPALAKAFELGERLQAARAVNEGLAAFVERSPGAVILVRGDGRVAHANRAAEALLALGDGLRVQGGALQADAAAGRRLAALVGAAAAGEAADPRGGALSLPRPSGRRALSVLVASARAEFGGEGPRLALVSVRDPEAAAALPLDQMRELFGLTPGEVRVVAELASGHGPREIGDRLGVSHHTVRAQLARAMAKTETQRQSDLVALVIRTVAADGLG